MEDLEGYDDVMRELFKVVTNSTKVTWTRALRVGSQRQDKR